jgi:hypothetical protein
MEEMGGREERERERGGVGREGDEVGETEIGTVRAGKEGRWSKGGHTFILFLSFSLTHAHTRLLYLTHTHL